MHVGDLAKEVEGQWEDVPLEDVYWREYSVSVLVPRDWTERPEFDAAEMWEQLKKRIDNWIAKRGDYESTPSSLRLQRGDQVLYDLLRAYETQIGRMGPCHDAALCQGPYDPDYVRDEDQPKHVISAKDAEGNYCPDCESEAERWYEQRYSY